MFPSFWAACLGCKAVWFQHNHRKDERSVLQPQEVDEGSSELAGEITERRRRSCSRSWWLNGRVTLRSWQRPDAQLPQWHASTPPRRHSEPPPASSTFLTAIFSGSCPGEKKKWAIIWSAQSGPQITGRRALSASARRLFAGGMEQLISDGTAAAPHTTVNNHKTLQLLTAGPPFSRLEVYRLSLTTKNIQKNTPTLKWIQVVGTHVPPKKRR